MVINDGKTQEINRGQPECNLATQQRRVGLIQDSSGSNATDVVQGKILLGQPSTNEKLLLGKF